MSTSENHLDGKDPNYWKSLKELNNDPDSYEAKANEFMKGVTDDFELSKLSGLSRRKFLALLGASTAFAAANCSNYRDKGEIVPYNKKPDEVIPGIANYYASTCNGCSQACGVLVKTREGRPIKIDGNPDHPINIGKICSVGQANILNLYDPNRLKSPLKMVNGFGTEISWQKADDAILPALSNAAKDGKEIAIITHSILSPTEKKLFDDFLVKYPTAKIYSYELFDDQNRNNAWEKSYKSGTFPIIKWENAKVILALDADFLGNEGNTIENIRKFTGNRDVMKSKDFNRLYVIEGGMTQTGMNADYRIRMRPDQQFEFVMSLISEVQKRNGKSVVKDNIYSLNDFVKKNSLSGDIVSYLVSDLIKHQGSSIVYAGSQLSEEVHIAVNALNEILGNVKLYDSEKVKIDFTSLTTKMEWENLIGKMNDGEVGVVIHYDTNPAYHFSPDFKYEKALKKVATSVSLVENENETSILCKYVLPINHYLESWGDYNVRTGVYSLQQPIISPLFGSRQKEAILLTWISGDNKIYSENIYHQYLMDNWEKNIYSVLKSPIEFKSFWFTALEAGVVINDQTASQNYVFNSQAVNSLSKSTSGDDFVLHLKKNYFLGDGRFANNGWLQELPNPVTKVVWDNYASMSASTAKDLNIEDNDVIEVAVSNRKVQLPVFIQPGMADKLLVVELGYGRTKAGEVGEGVGVNVNKLLGKDFSISKWIYNGVKISKTSDSYKLVTTQEKHSLDDTFVKDLHLKRGIIREGTLAEYKKNPEFLLEEKTNPLNITKDIEYKGVKWGMSIDMNKCVGCNQCVSSCNVENNIPVVGKEQVEKGRDMHWLRIDRYYSGSPNEPKANYQPMLCQHCDNAPCENVCPVAATNHSPDGLNQMVYNRCVGTRYCSNNCPYKVRRFNFFNFRDHFADGYYEQKPFDLINNPEVTVRSRGVMEKCTFCIQRIMEARQHAIEEGKPLKGSDVKTACQVACPAEAIVFGDVNDPQSEISKYREHELGYNVLKELNTRPNVTYIAKLRNTFSEDV
ncbi:MAG: TAT-variant-translocated molybdopterin oxidoreductase [Ignavibacteriales bacterium]|nr:TAT-variant-translocated molybdopterin oxidoreductase [Ignavibacteriales bacterium]